MCIWALKRDFGEFCTGEEPLCFDCRAYNARKFLEDVISLVDNPIQDKENVV